LEVECNEKESVFKFNDANVIAVFEDDVVVVVVVVVPMPLLFIDEQDRVALFLQSLLLFDIFVDGGSLSLSDFVVVALLLLLEFVVIIVVVVVVDAELFIVDDDDDDVFVVVEQCKSLFVFFQSEL
jgi:hypothetical protein